MKKSYIRTSTEKQNEIRQLQKVMNEYGVEKQNIYIEKISGKSKDNREKLNNMLSDVQQGDEIYIHEISRLARSIVDLKMIVGEIVTKGATVKFIKENLEFKPEMENNPMMNLMFNMLGAFAEFEREMIVSRVKEGVAIAKEQGKYKGRRTELCIGGKDENRYKAIVKAINEGVSIKEMRDIYKVGMGQLYRIKAEIESNKLG